MRKFGRLKEKIKEKFNTQSAFAEALGINVATLNLKLNGKTDWSLTEVEKVCTLLNISTTETKDYFFYS